MTWLNPIAFVVGLGLLAATGHVTISHTGGYTTPHAILTLAIAAGVGIGALAIGAAWAARRRGVARWLVIAILAGEAFGFLSTAERLVVGREASQAPLRVAHEDLDKARQRVSDAATALAGYSSTSPRLDAAMAAKTTADAAVVLKSAERGCLTNCRALLQAQVDAALAEVGQARDEIANRRHGAKSDLAAAGLALAAIQAPPSATPLADRLGMPAWLLDLLTAALGSIAANGLAVGLIAFAAHHRQAEEINVAEIVAEPRSVIRPTEHAAQFAVEALRKGGWLEVIRLHDAYRIWCTQNALQPLPDEQIVPALAHLFKKAGIVLAKRQGRLVAVGISLSGGWRSRARVVGLIAQSSK